jgi:twitching motility protein PilT
MVVRLMAQVPTAEQVGLPAEIVALADEPHGLVLVAGPRSSGKHTLLAALVDAVNHRRGCQLISIERRITAPHASRRAFISQREARGDDEAHAMGLAAISEDPDVLVLEDLSTAALLELALGAATEGRLVLASLVASGASDAVGRLIRLTDDQQPRVRQSLAQRLRAVVSQVLVPRVAGGRIAARELVVNAPSLSEVIANGDIARLPHAASAAGRPGLASIADALAAYVQNGIVDARDAVRHVADRDAFTALLERRGLTTPTIERLA